MSRTHFILLAAAACWSAPPGVVFRNASNQVAVNIYSSGSVVNAPSPPPDPITGGPVSLVGDPATLQDSNGNVYVMVRDATGKFWFNRYSPTLGWFAWGWTGGTGQGKAAMAFGTDWAVYYAIRGFDNRYWMGRRTFSGTFQGWYLLGANQFPIDPAMAGPGDGGAMYVVGGDPSTLYRTFFWPNATFNSSTWQGWTAMGGNSLSGTPGLGLGGDGRAYLAYRWPLDGSGMQGTTWMHKFNTSYAEGWYIGPTNLGPMTGQPSVVVSPAENRVYVLAKRPADSRYFYGWANQGAGNSWYTYWYDTGGQLAGADLAVGNVPFVAGRDNGGGVWWQQGLPQGGNPWLFSGSGAVGRMTSTPDLAAAFGPPQVGVLTGGSCPDPPTVTRGGPDVLCTVALDAPNYNHSQFSSIVACRLNPADSAVTVRVDTRTFSSITLRIRATASAQIASHGVECMANESSGDRWYPLWKNLEVTGSTCLPAISSIQVNNQSTNTIIQGVQNSLRITGTCFTNATSARIGSTPLSSFNRQGDTLITATIPSNPGGTGNQTLSVLAAQGTGTSNVFVTQLSIKQVSFNTSFAISRDVPGIFLPSPPAPPQWNSSSPSNANPGIRSGKRTHRGRRHYCLANSFVAGSGCASRGHTARDWKDLQEPNHDRRGDGGHDRLWRGLQRRVLSKPDEILQSHDPELECVSEWIGLRVVRQHWILFE